MKTQDELERIVDLARIPWSRKADAWQGREIENEAVIEAANELPEFPAGASPCFDLPAGRPRIFVAVTKGGSRFLVDTQGYDYARYIALLPPRAAK